MGWHGPGCALLHWAGRCVSTCWSLSEHADVTSSWLAGAMVPAPPGFACRQRELCPDGACCYGAVHQVRDEDEECFDMNPIEYIRRDSEGSDSDTRRRTAADLVRALTEKFEAQVTEMFTGYVGTLLQVGVQVVGPCASAPGACNPNPVTLWLVLAQDGCHDLSCCA